MDDLQTVIVTILSENLSRLSAAVEEHLLDDLCEMARQQIIKTHPLCDLDTKSLKNSMLEKLRG